MSHSTAVIQFIKYLLVNITHPLCNLKGLNEITSNSSSLLSHAVEFGRRYDKNISAYFFLGHSVQACRKYKTTSCIEPVKYAFSDMTCKPMSW